MKNILRISVPVAALLLVLYGGSQQPAMAASHTGNASVSTKQGTTFFQDIQGPKIELSLHPDPQVEKAFPNFAPPTTKVSVYLPLYPSATRIASVTDISDTGTALDADLVDGYAYFQSKHSQAQILSWYTKQLKKLGYTPNSQGSSENHGKVVSTYYGFSKSSAPDISLGFLSQTRSGETIYNVKAAYIVTPERPKDTYLPTDIVKVVLSEGTKSTTVTDSSWISKVVHQINALSVTTPGIVSGTAITANQPTVVKGVFYEKDGLTIQVQFSLLSSTVAVGNSKVTLDSRSQPALIQEIQTTVS